MTTTSNNTSNNTQQQRTPEQEEKLRNWWAYLVNGAIFWQLKRKVLAASAVFGTQE
jgi:hypothetical protein